MIQEFQEKAVKMNLGERNAFRPVKVNDNTFLNKLKRFVEEEEAKELL